MTNNDVQRVLQDYGGVEIELSNNSHLVTEIQRILEIKKVRRRIEIANLDSRLELNDWEVLVDSDFIDVEFAKAKLEDNVATKKRLRSPVDQIGPRRSEVESKVKSKRDQYCSNARFGRGDDEYPDARVESRRNKSPDEVERPVKPKHAIDFVSARKLLGDNNPSKRPVERSQGTEVKRLGSRPAAFVPPLLSNASKRKEPEQADLSLVDERLRNIDPKMIEQITNEIISISSINWDDIAGLDHAKSVLKETIIWPMLRPDIFTGIRGPTKGLLLFGPPGTGKTLIGKCIASQCKASFFSISSSTLVSKWIGDGEKMVRALFAVARVFSSDR